MKFRKKRMALFLTVLFFLLTALPVAAEDSAVTLERVVQINDYQLVLEFSQPIAFNYYSLSNGPFWAIRITDASYKLQKSGNTNLQWPGVLTYADAYHDRLLFTLSSSRLGIDTITGIMNFEGQLSAFKGSLVTFCFEEVPGGQSQGNDGFVGNVYDSIGMVQLAANRKGTVDGLYVPIEKDFSYSIDFSATEGIPNARVDAEVYVDTLPPETQLGTSEPTETSFPVTESDDSTIGTTDEPGVSSNAANRDGIVIGICAVISLAAIAVIAWNMKGRKTV